MTAPLILPYFVGDVLAEDEAGVNGSKLITGIRGLRKRKVPPTKNSGANTKSGKFQSSALQTEKRSETASSSSERMPAIDFLVTVVQSKTAEEREADDAEKLALLSNAGRGSVSRIKRARLQMNAKHMLLGKGTLPWEMASNTGTRNDSNKRNT